MQRVILNNHLFVDRDSDEVLTQLRKDCVGFIVNKIFDNEMEDTEYNPKRLCVYFNSETNKVIEVRIG